MAFWRFKKIFFVYNLFTNYPKFVKHFVYPLWYNLITVKVNRPKNERKNKMSYRVVFSAEGFDNPAYFDNAVSCDIFARMMASEGRLLSVKVDGLDITENYVTIIKIN